MKVLATFLAVLATTAAVPVTAPVAEPDVDVYALAGIERRQTVGTTANEFKQGGCRDIIWFFARGSTEVGNMVRPRFQKLSSLSNDFRIT
jgi:cutinase